MKIFGIKKRHKLTKKQILNYYQNGKVSSARDSAFFQQVILADYFKLLKKNYDLKKWHILEFGVGHGKNLPQMSKYFGKITAVDVTKVALLETKRYEYKNVKVKLLEGEKLPFPSNTFDLVVATEVLEHVPDLSVTSKELKRIIKNRSFILVSTPVYLNLRGISKRIMESILGEGTWEPARAHPGGYERLLTPGKIKSYFKDFKIIETRGADYGTAWTLPHVPLYPQKFAPFFEVTLGKIPPLKSFGMNYYFLAQKS